MASVPPLLDQLIYLREVVSLVEGLGEGEVLRILGRRLRLLDGYALQGGFRELDVVVPVRSRYGQPDGYAVPIDENAPLRT